MKRSENNSDHHSRRTFIRNAGMGAAAIAGIPLVSGSCASDQFNSKIEDFFSAGDVLLFQGDSITDAGRNKNEEWPNNAGSFGGGYAFLLASWLLKEIATKNLTLYNRGISGNKVYQLAERWDKDCLELKPDVLSILIGVNDYWHFREGRYEGTPEIYERDSRELLNRTLEALLT